MPSSRVSGHSAPQPGQTAAQYGSPLKRPSIAWSLPEEVALEVTAMSLMRIAIASPDLGALDGDRPAHLVPAADRRQLPIRTSPLLQVSVRPGRASALVSFAPLKRASSSRRLRTPVFLKTDLRWSCTV